MPHGISQADWNAAKSEARNLKIVRAKLMVQGITAVHLEAHDRRLFHLIGEISSEEDADGRGMLSVVVVHKGGDMQPGPGFFELAEQLGRDTSNILECWIEELHRVHAVWAAGNSA
jgi:hypothetical protein